jgi:hypothetical protein
LALNAKGGEINRPKQKGRNHHPIFQNFLIFQIGISAFAKTLLTIKRRKKTNNTGGNLTWGNFYLAKEKAFEKGENLSKLRNSYENSILTP